MRDHSSFGGSAYRREQFETLQSYLSVEETVEIARIQCDPSILGYALMTPDGTVIDAGGVGRDLLGPVFAHVFDMADDIGVELGEPGACGTIALEGDEWEVHACLLTSSRAVFIRRKPAAEAHGLRLVG